ncbi:MAG: hypothetical protein ACI31L_06985 [Limosilactobacillus sp.]
MEHKQKEPQQWTKEDSDKHEMTAETGIYRNRHRLGPFKNHYLPSFFRCTNQLSLANKKVNVQKSHIDLLKLSSFTFVSPTRGSNP